MANEPNQPAPVPAAAPVAAPASAPAPATSAAPEAPSSSASEALFKKLETHVPDKKMSWEDIQNTMNGTPPVTVPKPDSAAAPAEGAKVGDGVVTVPPAQPASVPAPAAQPVVVSAEEKLKQDLAARDAYIATLIAGGPQAPNGQPPKPAEPTAPVDDIPAHMYQLPMELVNGLRSEDPNESSKALSQYTALVARTMHKQLREEYSKKISDVVTQIPAMVQKVIQHQSETKAIFEDFYGEHKDLNKKELYPVVLNTALGLMRETNATSWTPEFKTALAARVRAILGTAQPAAPNPQPQYQPAIMSGGARPSAPVPTSSDRMVDDIMNTLTVGR